MKLSLEANPIGSTGMRQLMKAKNENQSVDFELNLKLCDNEVEMVNDSTSTATVSEPEELKDLTVKGFM